VPVQTKLAAKTRKTRATKPAPTQGPTPKFWMPSAASSAATEDTWASKGPRHTSTKIPPAMISAGKIHIQLRPSRSGGVMSSHVKYNSTMQQNPATALVSGWPHALFQSPTAADATSATPEAPRPPTKPASQAFSAMTSGLAQ